MFLGDFHTHSTFSDGKLAIPDLVDLYGTRGFGALAITDHYCEEGGVIGRAAHYLGKTLNRGTLPIYLEILQSEARRAWDRYQMVLIAGVEITKNSVSNQRSAHVVGLGITDWINPNLDILDITRAIRAQGALTVAAHPVWTQKIEKQTFHIWDRREELRGQFDAWEVASGPHIFSEVAKSDLPKIASSDLHKPNQITSWKSVFDCERHPEAIMNAIRKQEISFAFYEDKNQDDIRTLLDLDRLADRNSQPDFRNLLIPEAL